MSNYLGVKVGVESKKLSYASSFKGVRFRFLNDNKSWHKYGKSSHSLTGTVLYLSLTKPYHSMSLRGVSTTKQSR